MDEDEVKVVKTDAGNKDGQTKCPKCGATDISLNTATGKLRCNFCRHEFEPEKAVEMEKDISQLHGKTVGSGAQDIDKNASSIITLKCTSCGAEVVIDTKESNQARCHWCRNTLSINEQIPNGAIPDVVLPFKVKKEDAKKKIEEFVGNRKFYAHPMFKKEFSAENVMGVYLPYMIIDMNAHAEFTGDAEIKTREYKVKSGDNEETRYDADAYHVKRDFDVQIEGLTVESSNDKIESSDNSKTNNIINSIMPFDTENSVKWDANYLKGYTSEKRDMDISGLETWVNMQGQDIARFKISEDMKQYDRGVSWKNELFNIKGTQWKSAYLPVWLYSYLEKKGNENLLHYVAVNARTEETMGSVPIHKPKLFAISAIIEVIGTILGFILSFLFVDDDGDPSYWLLVLCMLSGFIYYFAIYSKYRNQGARHHHESETKAEISNLRRIDQLFDHRTGLERSEIKDENSKKVSSYEQAKKKDANR